MSTGYAHRADPAQRTDQHVGRAHNSEADAALIEHQQIMKAWLAAAHADRAYHWHKLEAAWRRVRALGVADQAQRNAAMLAVQHGKTRSHK